MNRRTFFKRIVATCAAAVVVPVVLMKTRKSKPIFKPGSRPGSIKIPEWMMRELTPMGRCYTTYDEFGKDHPQYWSLINRKWYENPQTKTR